MLISYENENTQFNDVKTLLQMECKLARSMYRVHMHGIINNTVVNCVKECSCYTQLSFVRAQEPVVRIDNRFNRNLFSFSLNLTTVSQDFHLNGCWNERCSFQQSESSTDFIDLWLKWNDFDWNDFRFELLYDSPLVIKPTQQHIYA